MLGTNQDTYVPETLEESLEGTYVPETPEQNQGNYVPEMLEENLNMYVPEAPEEVYRTWERTHPPIIRCRKRLRYGLSIKTNPDLRERLPDRSPFETDPELREMLKCYLPRYFEIGKPK